MTEHGYIRSIHRRIPRHVYVWKINDPYQGGVADAYYSGKGGDLWVEYKYLKSLPKKSNTTVRFGLTGQQMLWLNGRKEEGRNVAVVVGSPEGSVILTSGEWNDTCTKDWFIRRAIESDGIAQYIVKHTTPDGSPPCLAT